ncbi:hypothetical protein SFC15_17455 [Shouchella clausii]
MASIETFADFLRRNGHEVTVEYDEIFFDDFGEIYIVDGVNFPYRDVDETKFANLHKKYLLRNNAKRSN